MLAVVVVATLFTALLEELAFRGVLLRGLTAGYGTGAAMVVTSVLFAALHLPRIVSRGGPMDPLYPIGNRRLLVGWAARADHHPDGGGPGADARAIRRRP